MPWHAADVARLLETAAPEPVAFTAVSTDSRTLEPGALFVALVGPRFDGHRFIAEAAARGARGAVVRRGTPRVAGLAWFEVDDTLAALGKLARGRRHAVPGPVVAVTGSNGKTATKAMLAAALATRWRTHATRENLNNLVGVPLTILEAPEATEALVVECGTSLPGELARLRTVVDPSVGVVTSVAAAHLEGLGSVEAVLREKVSLLEGVPVAVVGQQPPELARAARQKAHRVVSAGLAPGATVTPDHWHVDQEGRAVLTVRGTRIAVPVPGRHQAENAMVALAVAIELGLDLQAVADAIEHVALPPGRWEIIRAPNRVIIHDAYNANPASLAAALETVRQLRGGRPLVLVVGTMLELGAASASLHEELADRIVALQPDLVGAVGEFVAPLARRRLGSRLITASDAEALGRAVAARLSGGELVLLKASRGVGLERAIPYLIEGGPCSTTS
jgi:UDP-N-acetylmuramoyl-tripeptide--D-alanyl-D-alanine ligase